ncbi:MAG: DNA polymerase III subunit beta [Chitinivibrionales bacterium]|nr:DNA polymerase III subunit beta [Chitinivibrionales bacterium]MBD3396045.1 DNA polymerase III subunit beta [Chitinivibrionales bacterium]
MSLKEDEASMPYTIEKKSLFELLQKAYPIVPTKSSLQMLSNLKVSLAPGTIEFMATDLDHSIKVQGSIEGDGEAELAVNARKLFEVVRELGEGPLTIRLDENVLILESADSFVCKIAGADTQDFPLFPEVTDKKEVDIPLSFLKNMIQKSSFAVSRDETRACLCGVLWEIDKKKTGMVATDGHRLGRCLYRGEFGLPSAKKSIVSPKSMLHIVRILSSDSEDPSVHVAIGEKYIVFTAEGVMLCSKLIEGPYPDYEKVIPKNNPKKAIIERSLLQEAVRRVSVLSNQKTHLVKFVFRNDELEIVVLNRDIGGEARQRIPIEYGGEEHTVGFNAAYLSEILGIITSQKVRIEMSTQISACLLFPDTSEPESEDLFLIMPLRIMEEAG